jgi:hypothetical protein
MANPLGAQALVAEGPSRGLSLGGPGLPLLAWSASATPCTVAPAKRAQLSQPAIVVCSLVAPVSLSSASAGTTLLVRFCGAGRGSEKTHRRAGPGLRGIPGPVHRPLDLEDTCNQRRGPSALDIAAGQNLLVDGPACQNISDCDAGGMPVDHDSSRLRATLARTAVATERLAHLSLLPLSGDNFGPCGGRRSDRDRALGHSQLVQPPSSRCADRATTGETE